MGIACSYGTVRMIVSGKSDSARGRKTKSRFAAKPIVDNIVRLPAINNPALTEKRTLYPHMVVNDITEQRLLKSGINSSKIGGLVLKGKWKGMPIYTLTLEERATCPTSCHHWRSCFGAGMNFARRMSHKHPEFEMQLVREIAELASKHRKGFVVRLHVLGDFFSEHYVLLWRSMIETYPQLHIFGYTVRQDGDEIHRALQTLVNHHWDRCAIRFSNGRDWQSYPATLSLEHPIQRPPDAFICPEQTGKTESCGTCAACWSTRKRVVFLQH